MTHNLFAYCSNTPVIHIDEKGFSPTLCDYLQAFINDSGNLIKSGIKSSNRVKHIMSEWIICRLYEMIVPDYGVTVYGYTFTFISSYFLGPTITLQLSVDQHSNIALQAAPGVSTGVPGISNTLNFGRFDVDNVSDLDGFGISAGGSVPNSPLRVVGLGAEGALAFNNDFDNGFRPGGTILFPIGSTSSEVHVDFTWTYTLMQWRLIE